MTIRKHRGHRWRSRGFRTTRARRVAGIVMQIMPGITSPPTPWFRFSMPYGIGRPRILRRTYLPMLEAQLVVNQDAISGEAHARMMRQALYGLAPTGPRWPTPEHLACPPPQAG